MKKDHRQKKSFLNFNSGQQYLPNDITKPRQKLVVKTLEKTPEHKYSVIFFKNCREKHTWTESFRLIRQIDIRI